MQELQKSGHSNESEARSMLLRAGGALQEGPYGDVTLLDLSCELLKFVAYSGLQALLEKSETELGPAQKAAARMIIPATDLPVLSALRTVLLFIVGSWRVIAAGAVSETTIHQFWRDTYQLDDCQLLLKAAAQAGLLNKSLIEIMGQDVTVYSLSKPAPTVDQIKVAQVGFCCLLQGWGMHALWCIFHW